MIFNKKAFSIVEVMAATAISSIVLMGTSTLIWRMNSMDSRQQQFFWVESRRTEILMQIESGAGWNKTLNLNPDMQCFGTGVSCNSFATVRPLKVMLGTQVIDGSVGTLGLNKKGDFCTNFDPNNGNNSCPIGIKLSWKALCDDTNCLHAQPQIIVKFQEKNPSGPLTELKKYDLNYIKDPRLQSILETCTAMGGTMSGINCTLPQLNSACSPSTGSFPIGYDAQGIVICGRPNVGQCASTDVPIGFNSNGNVICSPACQ